MARRKVQTGKKRARKKLIEVEEFFYEKPCQYCGEIYETKRPTVSRFCSTRCRMAAHRAKK
jgi:hypothetical protein